MICQQVRKYTAAAISKFCEVCVFDEYVIAKSQFRTSWSLLAVATHPSSASALVMDAKPFSEMCRGLTLHESLTGNSNSKDARIGLYAEDVSVEGFSFCFSFLPCT